MADNCDLDRSAISRDLVDYKVRWGESPEGTGAEGYAVRRREIGPKSTPRTRLLRQSGGPDRKLAADTGRRRLISR